MSSSINPSVGNFLDAVNVTSAGCSSAAVTSIVTLLPSVSLNLTTANDTQTVCVNDAITNIVYASTNATAVTVTGLPSGVTGTFDANTGIFTISGMPSATGTFNYTLTSSVSCNTVTLNGTIIVNPLVPATFTTITICSGDTVAFPATSLEGLTGTWNPATINNTQSATYTFTPNAGQCGVQGSLQVNVTQPTVPTFTQVAAICSGGTLSALPTTSNEVITGTWTPALNNTTTTTYTFTPAIGQCATTAQMTIVVTPNLVPAFTIAPTVCLGETNPQVLPTTSNNNVTGTWSPSSIDSSAAGSYTFTFTPDAGQCASTTTATVQVLSGFDFEILGSCIGNQFTLTFNPLSTPWEQDQASYDWYNSAGQSIGNNSTTFNVTEYLASTAETEAMPITFSLTVTTNDGCYRSHEITIERAFCGIQKGISLNNDGDNDFFDLVGYNVKQLNIFNRYGSKVYSKAGYSNEWHGQSDKGDELPDGTYYYVIDFSDSQPAKTGWIYVSRKQ